MAKQRALFKVTGKLEDKSFYYSRVDGYQVRKLDPTLSERVKIGKNYQNTRNTAAEFRAVANTASTICDCIWQEYPGYLKNGLKPQLVKIGMVGVQNDTSHEWGKRNIPDSANEMMRDCVNRFSKNPLPDFIKSWVANSLTYDAVNRTLTISSQLITTAAYEQWLLLHGVNYLQVKLVGVNVEKAINRGQKEAMTEAAYMSKSAAPYAGGNEVTGEGGHVIYNTLSGYPVNQLSEGTGTVNGLLVVLEPMKSIGTNNYMLGGMKALGLYVIKTAS